jgi:hypothetical protein
MKEILGKAKFISFASSSWFARRIVKELWWKNQELFDVYIVPPRFSMLIYHLGSKH